MWHASWHVCSSPNFCSRETFRPSADRQQRHFELSTRKKHCGCMLFGAWLITTKTNNNKMTWFKASVHTNPGLEKKMFRFVWTSVDMAWSMTCQLARLLEPQFLLPRDLPLITSSAILNYPHKKTLQLHAIWSMAYRLVPVLRTFSRAPRVFLLRQKLHSNSVLFSRAMVGTVWF